MQNSPLAFLTSLGAKPSVEGGVSATSLNSSGNAQTDSNGFFAILNRLLTPGGDANVPEVSTKLAAETTNSELLESLNQGELRSGNALIPQEGSDGSQVEGLFAPGSPGEAPLINVATVKQGPGAVGAATMQVGTSPLVTGDNGFIEENSLELRLGPNNDSANEQAFLSPRNGAQKNGLSLGLNNPVAAAAKALGETAKAEVTPFTGVIDADAPVSERSAQLRIETASAAADKTLNINPVRDQIIAAVVARQGEGRLEVRLDPPELGRVTINFEGDGVELVRAVVSADTPETLDLMRRHADAFQKSLAEQGFEGLDLQFAEQGAENPAEENAEAGNSYVVSAEQLESDAAGELDQQDRMAMLGRLDRRL
ncbi:flagellar hook-length control protein FliK [Hyphococcus flavus]|uniref:Flagellar hook-length control protein FliK n=1 Tax=Hyphococcus flavus TaxID=1866326 RepID=A0AAE9ZF49_9PROT|nr:flagellar hook-length control protein FliK [Hyphococcus flavus]WDI31547.1 flagellar hook-length control protein FliK [Hyphococcus flavus]